MMNKELSTILKKSEIAGTRYKLNTSFRFSSAINGEKSGSNVGSSLEFVDHREYNLGDDIRHVDWNAMAKYDKPVIRVFREEVTPQLELILDGSLSMNLKESKKYEALLSIANILNIAAFKSGCKTTIRFLKDMCQTLSSDKLKNCQEKELECDFAGDTGVTFTHFPPSFYPKSIRILLSDLFWNIDPKSILRILSNNSVMTAVIQIVSERDENPNLTGNLRLIDIETAEMVEIMADDTIIEKYLYNYNLHRDNWKNSCTSSGTVFTHLIAENFLKNLEPTGLLENLMLLPEG